MITMTMTGLAPANTPPSVRIVNIQDSDTSTRAGSGARRPPDGSDDEDVGKP